MAEHLIPQRRKPTGQTLALPFQARESLPSVHVSPLAVQRRQCLIHTQRPVSLQRQVAQPVLRAAELRAQEEGRAGAQRQALQRQVAQAGVTELAIQAALQRQAERALPLAAPARPRNAGDWVTVMRMQAQSLEGRRLSAQQAAQYTALQRQVAGVLAQHHRMDPSPGRAQTTAEHLVALQRHPHSAPVSRAVLSLVPVSDRPPLQRALDAALQREAAQQAQDTQALQVHALQRQLAELDAEVTQPVLSRIQARRGAGNPLPEAVRRHLEQGLNHDLSRVRIHDDTEADRLAKGVNALAFTTGTDIYFRSGTFNPNTQSGLELLAHEVTHTVQQAQGKVSSGIDPDASLEAEARSMGARLARPALMAPQQAAKVTSTPSRPALWVAPGTGALQRQAAGNSSIPEKVMKKLTEAVKGQDLKKALEVLRQLNRAQQQKALTQLLKQFSQGMSSAMSEGIQAMIDGLSGKVPQAIKKVARKVVKPGPWNPPAKQPVPFYLGTKGHDAIAAFYKTKHVGDDIFVNMTPMVSVVGARAARALSQIERGLKPDIVNMTRRHLYEIKPRGQAGLAIAEANLYLDLFKKAGVPMNLGPVDDPGVTGVVPAPGGHYTFQAIVPGAIVYDYRRGEYQPEALPATVEAPAPLPAPAPNRAPATRPQPASAGGGLLDSELARAAAKATGLTGTALLIYLLVSEASRVIPARNLIPLP